MSDFKTALIVDDNDELRIATGEYLEDLGYAVTVANDAEQALRAVPEAVPERGFDLLVSDVYMPGANGIELADRLLARRPALAVLLISSRGGEPEVRRRLAPGDIAFLAKPFSPGELAAKVSEAFRRVSERPHVTSPGPAGAASEPGTESTGSSAGPRRGAIQVAGVAALVLGLGALISSLEPGAPPLPAPVPGSAARSATIEVVRPLGSLAAAPSRLVWRPIDGASSYSVGLRAIDGTALWRAEVDRPPAEVPADVQGGLDPAVTYYWSVEAHDAGRKLLGRSELAPFVIELASRLGAGGPAHEGGAALETPQPEDKHHE